MMTIDKKFNFDKWRHLISKCSGYNSAQEQEKRANFFLQACHNFDKKNIDMYYEESNPFLSHPQAISNAVRADSLEGFKYLLFNKKFMYREDVNQSYSGVLLLAAHSNAGHIIDYMLSPQFPSPLDMYQCGHTQQSSIFLVAAQRRNIAVLNQLLYDYKYRLRDFELAKIQSERHLAIFALVEKASLTESISCQKQKNSIPKAKPHKSKI